MIGVAGIEADQRAGQIGLFQQRASGGHFVFLFRGEHGRDRDGGAAVLGDEADDLGEPVGNGLAIEGERGGELAVLGLQPVVQYAGQRLRIDTAQQGVEHVAPGRQTHPLPGAR